MNEIIPSYPDIDEGHALAVVYGEKEKEKKKHG
jgi:hypothetical protein